MATVLTNAGETVIAALIDNSTTSSTWYVGWGTGTSTAVKADTVIQNESADESRGGPITPDKIGTHTDTIRWQVTMTCATNPKTIANAGLLTLSSGGTLIIHGDFTGVVLAVGDKIDFTITLEIT